MRLKALVTLTEPALTPHNIAVSRSAMAVGHCWLGRTASEFILQPKTRKLILQHKLVHYYGLAGGIRFLVNFTVTERALILTSYNLLNGIIPNKSFDPHIPNIWDLFFNPLPRYPEFYSPQINQVFLFLLGIFMFAFFSWPLMYAVTF